MSGAGILAAKSGEYKAKAVEAHKQAKSAASKGIFKSPDFDKAATLYRDATKFYKLAGDGCNNELIAALRESGKVHKEINSFHTAAADLEKAAEMLAKDEKNEKGIKDAIELYRDAGNLYRANASYDKAATCYCNAAELAGVKNMDAAIASLDEAVKVFEDEKKGEFSESTYTKCVNFCLKYDRFDDAVAFIKRANTVFEDHLDTFEQTVYKNILSIIIIYFAREQYQKAAAEFKAAESKFNFHDSDAWPVAAALIQGWEVGDNEKLANALKDNQLKYLNTYIARMVKKIKLSEATVAERKREHEGEVKDDAKEVDLS